MSCSFSGREALSPFTVSSATAGAINMTTRTDTPDPHVRLCQQGSTSELRTLQLLFSLPFIDTPAKRTRQAAQRAKKSCPPLPCASAVRGSGSLSEAGTCSRTQRNHKTSRHCKSHAQTTRAGVPATHTPPVSTKSNSYIHHRGSAPHLTESTCCHSVTGGGDGVGPGPRQRQGNHLRALCKRQCTMGERKGKGEEEGGGVRPSCR